MSIFFGKRPQDTTQTIKAVVTNLKEEVETLEVQKNKALSMLARVQLKLKGQEDMTAKLDEARKALLQVDKLLTKEKEALIDACDSVRKNRNQSKDIHDESHNLMKIIDERKIELEKVHIQLAQAKKQYEETVTKLDETHRQYTTEFLMTEKLKKESTALKSEIQKLVDEREVARHRLLVVTEIAGSESIDERQSLELKCGPDEEVRFYGNSKEKKMNYYIAKRYAKTP